MGIHTDEKQLFKKWFSAEERKHLPYVTDGVVCEDAYLNAPLKVLFVLKEVNDEEGASKAGELWSLKEFLSKGGHHSTWNNVSRWAAGLMALPEKSTWDQYKEVDEKFRVQHLSQIAAINIKKVPGAAIADQEALAEHAKRDSELIRQQVALYEDNLDLIVTCGDGVPEILMQAAWSTKPIWQQTSRGMWYCPTPMGRPLIAQYHPAARYPAHLMHYSLMDAAAELLEG